MTTLTIVQARMSSQRLPGKVLKDIGGNTVLERVLARLSLCEADLGQTIVACSARGTDNPIAALCHRIGVPCYRSSEHDVLNRFYQAAIHYGPADTIIRVTADCPLLCPELLDAVALLMEVMPRLDYVGVANAPNGFGQEAVSFRALEQAWYEAKTPLDREHVITYIENRPKQFHVRYIEPDGWMQQRSHWRLTLDDQDDLDLLRRLYGMTGGRLFELSSREILDAVAADERLTALAARRP